MSGTNHTRATIDDTKVLTFRGPWQSKSGGELNVLFALPYDILQSAYFNYDSEEMRGIPEDVRGLRAYTVSKIPKGAVGANEWHKLRHELVFATAGSFRWTCEDLQGNKKEFILDAGRGVWNPPYILHTYEALEENSTIMVVANTLFNPDVPATHDSFMADAFHDLQAQTV